ncbi:MAG: glycosyltransferase family 2 protein [Acidobacteriota bacterium]
MVKFSASTKEKISACIITFNEEENIGECLESLKWADEIIVVDSGSTDRTEEICNQAGARFFVHPFAGFRDQKNIAVEKAQNDWIISLDADERVTVELREEIIRILAESGSKEGCDGYYVPRMNYYGKKLIIHSGWYPDYKIRVWRKSRGRWDGKNIHEKVVVDGKVGYLQGGLIHFTYRNIGDYLKRIESYSTWLARERVDSGKGFSFLNLLFCAPGRFIKSYILKLGFLDGLEGFIIGTMTSYLKFIEEIKVREIQRK